MTKYHQRRGNRIINCSAKELAHVGHYLSSNLTDELDAGRVTGQLDGSVGMSEQLGDWGNWIIGWVDGWIVVQLGSCIVG